MRMLSRFTLGISSALVTLALAGCGAAPADSTDTASTSEALSSLGKSILGEWDRASGSGPQDVTLQSDRTYFADYTIYCIKAPCPAHRVKGAWSLTTSGSSRGTLRLRPGDGSAPTAYALSLSSDTATLTLSASGAVETLHRPAPPTGQTCGGIANLQCPAGEECVYDDGPTYPDEAGTCETRGARGTMCGGIAALPCDAGLTWVITDPSIPDSAGICSAQGDHGTFCGGIAALPCNAGLTCVITASYPDAGGTCEKQGEVGTACAGIAGLPCNTGLVCKITDTGTSDAMGTCVTP